MSNLRKYLSRYIDDYLDPRFIYIIDLGLSFVASIITLLVVVYTTKYNGDPIYGTRTFALLWLIPALLGTALGIFVTSINKIIIRYSSMKDLMKIMLAVLIKALVMVVVILVRFGFLRGWLLVFLGDIALTLVFLVGVRILMMVAYEIYTHKAKDLLDRKRVLVYGTSDKAVAALTRLQNSPHYRIVGFATDEPVASNTKINGLSVFNPHGNEAFKKLADSLGARYLLFANEKEAQANKDVIQFCASNGIKTLVAPTIDEVVDGRIMKNKVREIKIEDLLGRDEIEISMDQIIANFKGKNVMVTGAAGSIGSELCRQLASFGINRLILYDNAETPMHNIRLELEERFPELNFVPVIGDVRQVPRLDFAFREYKPQIVFHAAAYKHVPLMEENPCEAVLVNVNGSRNVADKCIEYGIEKMVMVSTDKAVNPTNIMGCTKRLAEIYVQSLGLAIEQGKHEGKTKFVTTRFGNVLGSNGSVIPRFREQIEKGGPVTVTHPDITRFFMTIPEACRLVMEAATMSTGNQIFVFDMGESVKIDDLAKRMIELAGLRLGEDIEIEYTGLRPGEKLYEEVLSNKENTEPTNHDRIRIAKVREYGYEDALTAVNKLTDLSYDVRIPEMVQLMKATVPEFKSKNSRFEIYDK